MARINKFVIGIRPASRMFRIPSVIGLIIDSILSERGGKTLADDYFLEVASNHEKMNYRLRNDDLGNTLIINMDNIVFTKDYYGNEKQFNFKKVHSEFLHIWQIVNENLKIKDIRRIGIVAEHQFEEEETKSNKILVETLTPFENIKHPAKFRLKFENRHPTAEGLAPDLEKSDFINVIYDIYDSEEDADHPAKGSINANIDVQRYFSPLLKSNIPEQILKLHNMFQNERTKFETFLKNRGLLK